MTDERLQGLLAEALGAGRKRDYPRAVQLLQEILLHTDQMPEVPLYLGRAYHATGDFPRAIEAFRYHLRQQPDSAQGHFFLGRACFALGLLSPAVLHLRRSTELASDFPPAQGLLGLALLRSGHPHRAVEAFERALRLEPSNRQLLTGYLNSLLTYAVRLYFRRRYAEALECLLTLREHRPDSLPVQVYLASTYRELGEPTKALLHFGEASRLAPQDPVLHFQQALIHLQQGSQPGALEQMGLAMRMLGQESLPARDAQQLLRLMTIVLFRSRRHREALQCARRALRQSYQDADMHAIMAECFNEVGELDKAKNHYLRALEQQRNRPEFGYGLASVLWRRGEFRELEALLERILRQDPADDFATYYQALCLPQLGAACERTIPALQGQLRRRGADLQLMQALGGEYLRAGMPELAEGWLRRALQADPLQEDAWEDLLEVYKRQEDPQKLAQTYAEYLQHRPLNHAARRQYAHLLFADKRFAEACPQLERLLPFEPRSAQLRRMLAHCYRHSRRHADAAVLYRQLLLQDPKDLSLLQPLVACMESAGSREAAVALLEKAVKVFRKEVSLLLQLGDLYLKQKNLEKAAESYRAALALKPDSWQACQSLGKLHRKMGSDQFAERFLQRARRLRDLERRR